MLLSWFLRAGKAGAPDPVGALVLGLVLAGNVPGLGAWPPPVHGLFRDAWREVKKVVWPRREHCK